MKEKEKERVGVQTRSKKVVIDEVLFGDNEENEEFKIKRKEEEAEVVRLGEEEEVGSEYLNDVFVVELSVKDQDREDVKEAIQKELENMNRYGVVGENMPIGNKEVVGTRMVVTESEKHDGQKKKI